MRSSPWLMCSWQMRQVLRPERARSTDGSSSLRPAKGVSGVTGAILAAGGVSCCLLPAAFFLEWSSAEAALVPCCFFVPLARRGGDMVAWRRWRQAMNDPKFQESTPPLGLADRRILIGLQASPGWLGRRSIQQTGIRGSQGVLLSRTGTQQTSDKRQLTRPRRRRGVLPYHHCG